MERHKVVETLQRLHESWSIDEILDGLAVVCRDRAAQEEDEGNSQASVLYMRAQYLIDSLGHIPV